MRILDVFRKVYCLEYAILQIRESFFRVSNHFSKVRRSFIHQKLRLTYRALLRLLLFSLKRDILFLIFNLLER